MSPAPHPVICRWVPGTLDRIRVLTGKREEILDINDVARRFGRDALNALYLNGRYIQAAR